MRGIPVDPCKVKMPAIFTLKSECGDFKITGIAGIHAIPVNLKSLHSDFPVEFL